MEGTPKDVGSAVKATKEGLLPIGTVADILKAAPKDLKEEVLEVPEWGYSVRLRSFTAAQSARIKTVGFSFTNDGDSDVAWAEMEKAQFQEGVIEPKFSDEQVLELHLSSGPGFRRVISKLDEMSNLDKEAVKKAQEEFRKPDEPAAV